MVGWQQRPEVADVLRLGESAAGIEVVALTTQLRAPGEPRYNVQFRTSRVGASAADFAILADIVPLRLTRRRARLAPAHPCAWCRQPRPNAVDPCRGR